MVAGTTRGHYLARKPEPETTSAAGESGCDALSHAAPAGLWYTGVMLGRALVLVTFAALIAPRVAWATACCGEASGLGDRLLDAEEAAVSVRLSTRGRTGSFGSDGTFHALPDGARDVEVALAATASVRITPRLELGAETSGKVSFRSQQGENRTGGGMGDVRTHARFAVLKATEDRFLPGIYVVAGALLPTGVPASRSTPGRLSTDVTGQGNAEVLLGCSLEKTYESAVFVRAESSVGFFLPETVDTVAVARAPRLGVGGFVGPVLDPVVVGAGATYEHEAAPPGAPAGTTGRSKLELVVAGSLDLDVETSLLASLRAALPVADFGTNEIASVSASIGVRFGFF